MRDIFCFLIILSVLIQDSSLQEWLTNENCTNIYNELKSNFYDYDNKILENVVQNTKHSTQNILHIEPFCVDPPYTGFLIRFSNISFTTITQTFIGQNYPKLQGKFGVFDNKELFYDCIKIFYKDRGEVFDFHFEHVEKRKYNVRVPCCDDDIPYFNATDINELKIFFYVDVTYPNFFTLKIQIAPKRFNITSYEIKVQRKKNDVLNLEQIFYMPANKSENGVIDFVYPTAGVTGSYNFSVKPIGSFVNISEDSLFFVGHIEIRDTYIFLITGCILMCILSPIFLVVLYNYYKPDASIERQQPPKEIIIEWIEPDVHFYCNFNIHKYNLTGIPNENQQSEKDKYPDVTNRIRTIQEPLLVRNNVININT